MFSQLFSILASLLLVLLPSASHAAVTGNFSPGDLIRGSAVNTVYYFAPDGKRYVFPNEKTYFTWYADFSGVKTITDGQLSAIPLGKNITYRPGYKMVKITTDPKVYAVEQGGILRWVTTQEIAETLYGMNWKNRIDDVPDAFFTNYQIGTPITSSAAYDPQDTMTLTPNIAIDKQFDETQATVTISSVSNGFVPPSITIQKGETIVWTNRDINAHTATGSNFSSGTVQPNQSYSREFTSTGSYDYTCSIHPSMKGTINVVD